MQRLMRSYAGLLFSYLLWSALFLHAAPNFALDQSSINLVGSARGIWSRVILIGASATAGMRDGTSTTVTNAALYAIRPYLDAAITAPHDPVASIASPFFFLSPAAMGKAQIQKASKADASLVIGVDFLFWYCYGNVHAEEDRMRRFEAALSQLGQIKCPLVLGDIPDASAAENHILGPEEIPHPETISAVNRRLKEWAAARKQTTVVRLAEFMKRALLDEPIEVHGEKIVESHVLLQADKLHPTARGAAVLALAIANQIEPFYCGWQWRSASCFDRRDEVAILHQRRGRASQRNCLWAGPLRRGGQRGHLLILGCKELDNECIRAGQLV
jgi:hypothetical protein